MCTCVQEVQHMWLVCNIFSSSVKSRACHCIVRLVGQPDLLAIASPFTCFTLECHQATSILEVWWWWMFDNVASWCKLLQGHVRRDFVRGAESPHWRVLRLATEYFAIWKIWKYSWSFLQKRLNPVLLLGLKPPLCSIVVMWPSQLNQLTSAFLAPATMSNKPGLPRMLMTPHLIH